ncbi:unnamed protein product, partial [Effrenium voratum]
NLFQNLPVLHSGAIFCQTEAIENTRRKAKNPSKICGLKTADAKEARQFGRDLLDAPMLIFCSFHYEHRRQNLLAVAAHGQSSAMPNNVKFTLAVEALLAMSEDRVTFAALQNAVWFWSRLESFLIADNTDRWAARYFQQCITQFRVSLGIRPHERWPLSEPGAPPKHKTKAETRTYICKTAVAALERVKQWAKQEAHFFRCRCLWPDANMPKWFLTHKGMHRQKDPESDAGPELDCPGSDSSETEDSSSSDSDNSSSSESGTEEAKGASSSGEVKKLQELELKVDKWVQDPGVQQLAAGSSRALFAFPSMPEVSDGPARRGEANSLRRVGQKVVIASSQASDRRLWQNMIAGNTCYVAKGQSLKPGQRSQLSSCAAYLFLARQLLHGLQTHDELWKTALRELARAFGPYLWGLQPGAVRHLVNPPEEMFAQPSEPELQEQFLVFRNVAVRISSAACAAEKFQKSEVLKWDEHLHSLIVQQSYTQARHYWHVLRLFHRLHVWGFASEAICESAVSIMRYLEKKHSVGRPLRTAPLVEAALLRFYGVDGRPESWPFLLKVLSEYFRKRGKGQLRFFVSRRTTAARSGLGPSAVLHRHRQKAESMTKSWMMSPVAVRPSKLLSKDALKALRQTDAREPDDFYAALWDCVLPALASAGVRVEFDE